MASRSSSSARSATATTAGHDAGRGPAGGTDRDTGNRQLRRLSTAIVVLALIGLGIAGYLAYGHYNDSALVCTVGDCGTVQKSQYSTIGPLPIALLGIGMFVTVGTLAALRARGIRLIPLSLNITVSWMLLLAGVAYYVYLTYLEVQVIEAICQWCVLSSIATLGMFLLESRLFWVHVFNADDLSDAEYN